MLTAEQRQIRDRLRARRAEVAALPRRHWICPHCLTVYHRVPVRFHGRCPRDNHRTNRREAVLAELDKALRWYVDNEGAPV